MPSTLRDRIHGRSDPQLRLPVDRNELETRYRAWKAAHPGVFELFRRFARERLMMGRHFGIGALTERVRWEIGISWGLDEDGFRINNSYRAYLIRDLIQEMPGLADLVETRRVKGEAR